MAHFAIRPSVDLLSDLRLLSGKRLLCHCSRSKSCRADALIRKFSSTFPGAYDRRKSQRPPTPAELNLLATHREEPQSEEGLSADEAYPPRVQVGATRLNRCLWESDIRAESTVTAKASRLPDGGQSREGISGFRQVAERSEELRELCRTTRHNEIVDDNGHGESEGVFIQTSSRTTSTKE